jgi:O-antigen ligase
VSVARVPATKLLLVLHGLVLLQLVPLPPQLLKVVSPGSFSFYDYIALVPLRDWRPISVSPADTALGLVFLTAMSCLYAAAFRDFADNRWRRRAVATVVATALIVTVEALFQAATADPRRIYGIWKPTWWFNVFGPYVNANHFAGYVVMAIPLATAWTASALRALRRDWGHRRIGWLALGDATGNTSIRRLALTLILIIGLAAAGSRGGIMACFLAIVGVPLLLKRRRWAVAAFVVLVVGALFALGPGALAQQAERGFEDGRFDLWRDALRMVVDFPLFGTGMNTFGTAYARYQKIWKQTWIGEAHNEYLQLLFDLGSFGFVLGAVLAFRLLATAKRNAPTGVISVGLLGSLLASAVHALVEFNWQIPANAATFATLAGLAMQTQPDARLLDPPKRRA